MTEDDSPSASGRKKKFYFPVFQVYFDGSCIDYKGDKIVFNNQSVVSLVIKK